MSPTPPAMRQAGPADHEPVWAVLEPMIRAGETYPLPRDMTRAAALAYWFAPHQTVFVAHDETRVLGTFYLKANQPGAGAHVANCGYVVHPGAQGRGIARAMCRYSLNAARQRGFRAMQFNRVVATNTRAVALWQACGFAVIGRLPGAFVHPVHGEVDALIMYQRL